MFAGIQGWFPNKFLEWLELCFCLSVSSSVIHVGGTGRVMNSILFQEALKPEADEHRSIV